jgi:hypothetical protein
MKRLEIIANRSVQENLRIYSKSLLVHYSISTYLCRRGLIPKNPLPQGIFRVGILD